MSKLRALELALDLHRIGSFAESPASPDAVLVTAGMFAAFLGEETPSKPARAKPTKVAETAPVIADPETPAQPAKEETKPVAAQAAAPAASAPAAAAIVTEVDVKAAVGKLATNAAAGGAPKARQILSAFGGATNISTLKPEFYGAAVTAINAVLEAAAVAA